MKYLVLEIQTAADGKVATIITAKDELNEAMSAYYMILAAAAVSLYFGALDIFFARMLLEYLKSGR